MSITRIISTLLFVFIFAIPAITARTASMDTFDIYLSKSKELMSEDKVEESIHYLKKAKTLSKTADEEAIVFNDLGSNYFELSDYHTSIYYFDSAFALRRSIKNPHFIGYLYNNYGLVYTQLMEFKKAVNYFKMAIGIVDQSSIGVVYYNIAKCFTYLANSDSTKYYLNLSYSKNKDELGPTSYYTLLTDLELTEKRGAITPILKQRILQSNSNHLKGLYYSYQDNFSLAENYFKDNPDWLLKLYVKSEQWGKAINIMDTLRSSYLSVDSKLFLQANERLIYKNGIDTYIAQNDTLKAFQTALKSHANVLKEDLNTQIKNYPDSYNYFDFDSTIYLFVVTNGEPDLYKIKIDVIFQNEYTKFLSTFNLHDIENNFKLNFRNFSESSSYLYKKLLPVISDNMLIIPEGRIFYIPFETLLVETPDTAMYPDYKKLEYLLFKSDIRYDYFLREHGKPKHRSQITAFAPDESLKFSVKEVKTLRKYDSRIYIGSKAKAKNISNSKILHIASHYDPAEYKLRFSDSLISLTALDSISSDLVVLSTCYSGLGEDYVGEGVFSASRAFYKAGAKSVIESLWPNNDRSAYMIFKTFYKNIYNKQSKDKALTNAKIIYLDECFSYMSHPYFWGNLRLFGNPYPLKINLAKQITYTAFGLIFLVLVSVLFKYFFRFRSK